jgi:hypothetical protein
MSLCRPIELRPRFRIMRQRGVTPLMYQSGKTVTTTTGEDGSLTSYRHPMTLL